MTGRWMAQGISRGLICLALDTSCESKQGYLQSTKTFNHFPGTETFEKYTSY